MRPLSKLGLKPHPTCERWSMCTAPLPLGEMPHPAPEEVEAAGPGAILAITSPEEPAKEIEPSSAVETSEGQNPNAPQKIAESTNDAQVSHAEGLALLVEPFQAVHLGKGSKDLETSLAQLSERGAEAKPKE